MLLIQTNRNDLLKPLQMVIGIVEKHNNFPILSNVLMEREENLVCVTATDFEIQITATATLSFLEGTSKFSVTFSAKKLQDIFRTFSENTKISLDSLEDEEGRLHVRAGKSRFVLQTLPAGDFPKLEPSLEKRATIRIGQKTLKNLLGLVQYSMAQQDIRYYLNGLLLAMEGNKIKAVATDGHRLGMANYLFTQENQEENFHQEVILPRKTIIELTRLLDDSEDEVTIEVSQNQARFSFSNIVLVSKIIEGKFPDYNRVIPEDYQNHLQVNRIALLQSLQRVAILSNEKIRGVRLVLTRDSLVIICNNNEQEEAQEEIEISYTGNAMDIGFNVNYLLDVLNNQTSEMITLSFGDANSSVLFSVPDNENFKYVVMPMRI